MKEFYRLQAGMCRTIANPVRLEIIHSLKKGEISASRLLREVKISKANLSQHMAILLDSAILNSRREGKQVFYRIADKRILTACAIIKQVLISKLKKDSRVLKKIK